APIASARVITAAAAKPGIFNNVRTAYRMSCPRCCIISVNTGRHPHGYVYDFFTVKNSPALVFSLFLAILLVSSCSPKTVIVQPGAPGSASRTIGRDAAVDVSAVQATKDDVEFMQGMIHHHLQAIDMTNLLAANTQSEDMRKLGLRMAISQSD